MIYFFGYGADRDPELMEAIIGRKPQGEKTTISGFELCIQSLADIPSKAQRIIRQSWDHGFHSYVIRPAKDMHSIVSGMMWELSPLERKLIDNWELTGLWYDVFFISKGAPHPMQMELQIIQNQPIRHIVDGTHYKTFLNDKNKMIETATRIRLDYLK
ncbi:MAG TPA: gamma-glutamylcyclotransferase family protein [Patescibacteria group bacterium]|nr:gamma-glutamylcyclotransferase family protein [Patescibacteria group bacterium]